MVLAWYFERVDRGEAVDEASVVARFPQWAVELALVLSVAFNVAFLLLWSTEYGEREGMKRYMADLDAPPEGEAAVTSPGIPGQE